MSIQQNARAAIQSKAEATLSIALTDLIKEHELTTAEVCAILSVSLTRWTGYQVRDERSSGHATGANT